MESSTELLNGGKTALNQPDLVAHIGLAVRQNEILSGRGGGKGRWGAEDISLQTRATHSLRRSKGETGRDRNIWGDGKAIWVDLLTISPKEEETIVTLRKVVGIREVNRHRKMRHRGGGGMLRTISRFVMSPFL